MSTVVRNTRRITVQQRAARGPIGGSISQDAIQALVDEGDALRLAKAANLSDVASPSAARANLGLGDSATRDVGTTAGTVAAGDDGRFEVGNLTRAEAALFTVPPSVSAIRTTGYSAAGDGGGGLYVRVETEPAHAGKVQSADGAWWELSEVAVTLPMFGGARFTGLIDASENGFRGTNRTQFTDALSALMAAQEFIDATRGAYLLIDGYYYFSDCRQITTPQAWRGVGMDRCGVRFAGTAAAEASIRVLTEGFDIRDMEICADDRGGVDPGNTGDTGTCITSGRYFYDGEHEKVEWTGTNLLLTRAVGGRASHALGLFGRTRRATLKNIVIDGELGGGHQDGWMAHWGANGEGIGAVPVESYHPDNVEWDGAIIRGVLKPGHCASVAHFNLRNLDMTGGSSVGITQGDEGATYAHAEVADRVGAQISITKVVGRNLTLGLEVGSRSTSKVTEDETEALRYYQTPFGSLCFDDWDLTFEEDEADQHLSVGMCICGSFSARNWRTQGRCNNFALEFDNNAGNYVISGTFDGPARIRDGHMAMLNLEGATFTAHRDDTTGAPSILPGSRAMLVTGRDPAGTGTTLDENAAAGATSIVLASPISLTIFKGMPVLVNGMQVYATDIFRSGCTTIAVTPLPEAATSGQAVLFDYRFGGLTGRATLIGGEYGLETDHVVNMALTGTVQDFGQYGHYCVDTQARFSNIVFKNGGLGRIASSGLGVGCVYHGAGSYLSYYDCSYGVNSEYLNRGIVSDAGAVGGRHVGGLVYDIATPLALAGPSKGMIEVVDVRSATTGALVSPATPKSWSPVLKIGGTEPPGITYNSPRMVDMGSNAVKLEVRFIISDIGALTGAVTIEGFPYSSSDINSVAACRVTGATGLTGQVTITPNGTGAFVLEQSSATGQVAVTEANLTSSTQIRVGWIVRRG